MGVVHADPKTRVVPWSEHPWHPFDERDAQTQPMVCPKGDPVVDAAEPKTHRRVPTMRSCDLGVLDVGDRGLQFHPPKGGDQLTICGDGYTMAAADAEAEQKALPPQVNSVGEELVCIAHRDSVGSVGAVIVGFVGSGIAEAAIEMPGWTEEDDSHSVVVWLMPFNRPALARFLGLGLGLLAFGIWMLLTGPTTAAPPFRSPISTRLMALVVIGGSMSSIIPGMWMFPRRRDAAIENRGARVVAGRTRDLEWKDIQEVSCKPYAVDLRLHSGERVRVYGRVVGTADEASIEETAGLLRRSINGLADDDV